MLGYYYAYILLIGLLVLGGAWARYQPQIMSNVDFAMRCFVYPVIEAVFIPIANLLRLAYNPLICWWNAANWFVFGYFNNVLGPTALACGARQMLIDFGCVFTQLFETLIFYIVSGQFLTGFYDMSTLSAAIVQFVDDWILLLCCMCADLCSVVRVVPFVLPFLPMPLGLIIPALFPEYEFWQSFESLINFVAAILQIIWPLVINLLLLQPPMQRPQFNTAFFYLCQFFQRLVRAIENTLQRFWDSFIPWPLQFENMLCAVPTFLCIAIDGINFGLTLLVNIDIVVFNVFTPAPNSYIGPPYTMPVDVWRGALKDIAVLAFNSFAPVTDTAYRLDLAKYQRISLVDCICIFITRLICDQIDAGLPCFNEDPGFATTPASPTTNPADQGFFKDFNFCCLTTTLIITVNDFFVGVYDMTQHFTSASDWFCWLDTQPHTNILVQNLVNVAECLFSITELIPVVGFCFKNFNVELNKFIFSVVGFLLKIIIALVTLIWDFLAGTYDKNFLLRGAEAITEWEGIVDILIGMTAGSLLNCLQYILNVGIQIPPITLDANGQFIMCDPPCVPVDFIPPPEPPSMRFDNPVLWEKGFLSEKFTNKMKVTPILSYNNQNASEPWFHPVFMKERLFSMGTSGEFLPINMANIDDFFQQKREEFYDKFNAIQDCHRTDLLKERLRKENPWKLKYLVANNKLPDTSHCFDIGAYDYVYGGKSRQEQYDIFMQSADAYDVYASYGIRGSFLPTDNTERYAGKNTSVYLQYAAGGGDPEQAMLLENMRKTNMGFSMEFVEDDEFKALYGNDDETLPSSVNADMVKDYTVTRPPRLIPPPPPLTTRPTSPPIMGCPDPGQPPNPCFDLACIPRSSILTIGQILLLVPHILDGLVRGNFPDPGAGEVKWGYFIGHNCSQRCLEEDIIKTVIVSSENLVCICKLLNLILPSSPQFPQPDFCCFLTRLADLTANAIQVTINGIKSLTLDSPRFIYFNEGYFVRDINELFDETLGVVVCLCQFARYIFPISQLTGGTIDGGGAFDVCCVGFTVAEISIETLRFVILIIVNLATIEGFGINFWRTSSTQPDLHQIGFNVQARKLIQTWFGMPGGVCAGQGKGQGIGGITSCVCQLINLVIPIRANPGAPVSENNCPTVDLCCAINTLGYFLGDWTYFQVVAITGLWQSWDPADNGRCPPGNCAGFGNLPYAFIDYLFCQELTEQQLAECTGPNATMTCPVDPSIVAQQPKCGKLFPIIDQFVDLISTCPCSFLALVDAWLSQTFTGFDCFCGPVGGVFTNLGDLVKALTLSITTLIRRANDINYWQPFGKPGPNNMSIQFSVENTWTFSFFGPIIDALCNTLAASTCFLDILLPFCQELRKRIVRSMVVYSLNIILLVGAFIEGVIGIFTTNLGQPAPGSTGPLYGQNVDAIASLLIGIFSGPMNGLFGDSSIVCSMVNPPLCPDSDPCCCYNRSPNGLGFVFVNATTGPFSQPGYQCAQCDAVNCTSVVDSFAYPTCRLNTTGFRPCFDETSIGSLLSCDANNPLTTKLDGGFMAFARYFQCALGMLVPAFATIMQGLVILMSIFWQLYAAILQLWANIIVFIYGLFDGSSTQGSCSIGFPFAFLNFICTPVNLLTNFINIFVSAAGAFVTGVVLPNQPVFRSMVMSNHYYNADGTIDFSKLESRHDFSRRLQQSPILYGDPDAVTAADKLTFLFDVIWGYSTEDCMEDFSTCACRNLPLDMDMCIEATTGSKKRDMGTPTVPVVNAVAGMMAGKTMCDNHIKMCANMTWQDVPHMDKVYYVDCLEKVVQGGRLNEMDDVIPKDYFYRHEGPLVLWENVLAKAAAAIVENQRAHERLDEQDELHKEMSGYNARKAYNEKRFADRRERVKNYALSHPRWKKSMITPLLIEMDQFEYKMRIGYYKPMLETAARNLKEGRLPRLTFKSRVHHLVRTFKRFGTVMYNIRFAEALGTIFDGFAATYDVYETFKHRTPWQLWKDALDRHNAKPEVAEKIAQKQQRNQMIRDAFYSSPLYRWWATPPQDVVERHFSKRDTPQQQAYKRFTAMNPLSRFFGHLQHVYRYHRENWDRHPPNLMTMDKHIRHRVHSYFERKLSLKWTPQILANWQSAARLYYRLMEGFWPGSVGPDVIERFSRNDYSHLTQRMAQNVSSDCVNASAYMREIQAKTFAEREQKRKRDELENSVVLHNGTRIGRGFIVDGNCLLMDGFINQTVFLVTYCAFEFMPNLPQLKRQELTSKYGFWRAMDEFAERGRRNYASDRAYLPGRTQATLGENDPYNKEGEWTSWLNWLGYRGQNWVRYKVDAHEHPGAKQRRTFMQHVTRQQWMAATRSATFSLIEWFLDFIDWLLGTNLGMEIQMIVMNIEEFIDNTNEDWYAGPVGLRYWLLFWTRCVFQPKPGQLPQNAALNLNCQVGIGLGPAIAWVTGILLAVYIVGSLFIPPILMVFNLIPITIVWLILVPAVGWHYSPRCWLMTPSLLIPGYGSVGIDIPYWPFPIAFPALPFCLMDEVVNLVLQFFPYCWCQAWWGTSLEFICPPYMVTGDTCPPCPQKITVLWCRELGISDGVDVLAYLSNQYFPWFSDVVRFFFQTVPFSGEFGMTLADIGDYVVNKFSQFMNLTELQQQQFGWCSVSMALSLSIVILIGLPLVTFTAFAWQSFVLGLASLWSVITASGLAYIVPGEGVDSEGSAPTDEDGNSSSTSQDPFISVRIEDTVDRDTRKRRRRPLRRREAAPVMGFVDDAVKATSSFVEKLKRD